MSKDEEKARRGIEAADVLGGPVQRRNIAELPWYLANGLVLFWMLLFFAVVIPLVYRLPTALTKDDVDRNEFIAERAYKDLYALSGIGRKMVGSKENEIQAVEFLLKQLTEIKEEALKDLFEIDIDLSQASGMFARGSALRMYQGLQNIAVKLTPKNSTSRTYLLVNSHFDSQGGAGAGDAGFMIVVMLETLRAIATTRQTFDHPIVFLFNGAEENGLQASLGFITQHKWAPYCKYAPPESNLLEDQLTHYIPRALVNLDAAGSGGREVLFQSGPNHPWLVDYYKRYIKHPFATTLAEEIFQAGIMPSDTDFRQFMTYGNIPGLDMAQVMNGFIYHTNYDLIDVIPRESLQNTGDNVLSLVRGLANATELYDTEVKTHNTGHAVFFDVLGLYFIYYSETTGIYINCSVAMASFIFIFISMWRMADASHVSFYHVFCWFILVLIVQTLSFALGLILPATVALVMDNLGLSLTYYSTPLLVIGLYVCPSLLGLSLFNVLYYSLQRNERISDAHHLQLSVHGQAFIVALLTIGLTLFGMRSTYVFVIPLGFYLFSLILNLLLTLHDRSYGWTGLLTISQIIPFLYSSYLSYILIVVLIPMGGRAGSSQNRDLYIGILAGAGTVLSLGFLVPLTNTFRRPSFVLFTLMAITGLSLYLASCTKIGFPYKAKTNGQRLECLQVRNKFYEYDGSVSTDESGYLFNFEDRLKEKPLLGTNVNLTDLVNLKSRCEAHTLCGMPLFHLRFIDNQLNNKWLPRDDPIEPPAITKLELLRKTELNSNTIRLEFQLTGPPCMRMFIQPYEDVTISNWSFLRTYLDKSVTRADPYIIFLTYGIDSSAFTFYLDCSKPNGDFNVPLVQLGVSGHYIGYQSDPITDKFLATFPSFTLLDTWPVLYQRYIF